MTSSASENFIGRAEKRDGDKIPAVYLKESEYHAYAGCGQGILTVNSEGSIKKIKYLHEFPKIDDIAPFMNSLGTDYVVGMLSGYTVTMMIRGGSGDWTLDEIIGYLEEEFCLQEELS